MKHLLSLALAAATLTAGASQAAAAGAPARQCFRVSQMNGHTVADARTLYIRAARRDVFRLDMAGACLGGARFGDPLVIESFGGLDLVCKPIDLNLKVAESIGLSPCIVSKITRLSPAEVASLPKKLKP